MNRSSPLPLPTRVLLFEHLAAMEKAGVPAERAYALLDLGALWRGRIDTFRRLYGRGVDPATAGANSGLFNPFEARLLRAALSAGSPQATYERLARSLACAAQQHRALRSRLMLPGTVLTIALFVQPIPQLITGALSLGGYLGKALLPLIVLAVGGMLALRTMRWFASGEPGAGRATLERLLLDLPVFGHVHLRRSTRDFTSSLALLLRAGLPLFDALPVAVATVGNHLLRADLATLLPAVQAGAPLSKAISALRLVDTVHLFPIVHTGEQSGTLAETLQRFADAESVALAQAQNQMMMWLPRIVYSIVALWMAVQIVSAARVAQPRDALARAVPQWRS
jgi:type II secretory pathway component PulF